MHADQLEQFAAPLRLLDVVQPLRIEIDVDDADHPLLVDDRKRQQPVDRKKLASFQDRCAARNGYHGVDHDLGHGLLGRAQQQPACGDDPRRWSCSSST